MYKIEVWLEPVNCLLISYWIKGGKMNKAFKLIIVSVVALTTFTSIQATGEYNDITILVADEAGMINHDVKYAASAFLLLGFDSAPLLLDITDPAAPIYIAQYQKLQTPLDNGALLVLDSGSSIFACGEDLIIDVASIDLY